MNDTAAIAPTVLFGASFAMMVLALPDTPISAAFGVASAVLWGAAVGVAAERVWRHMDEPKDDSR